MSKKSQKPVTVAFIALGCAKNIVDSERMLAEIAQGGLLITTEPEDADAVVVNTCGFIAPAKAEALEAIQHAVDCKTNGRVKKVIVAGCLSQRLKAELFEEATGIDAIVGLEQRDNIARIITKTMRSKERAAYLDVSPVTANYPEGDLHIADDRARLLITPPHFAYLRISEGCDHRCGFCTIPAIRGRFRSKPKERILEEALELVNAGVVELNIIGQDTSHWGRDLKIKNGLATLISELEKIEPLVWIRLMYLYPAGISDRLIETIAQSDKIVHYLDIPIQHINNKILKDMRRPDSAESIRRMIERLRSKIPDAILRTTVIVGLPGETDEQFNELLDFVKWAEFDALGGFRYYAEPGTPAAEMTNQVPDEIKQQRLEELMLTQQEIAFAKNKNRIGSRLKCLVDTADGRGATRGRFYGQAPDIDSVCIVEKSAKDRSIVPGQFIDTEVTGTKEYDLLVRQIES